MVEKNDIMDKIVSLCKRRGFIFQSSEIYGGIAGIYDYGPMGVELKRNLKNLWWQRFVLERADMVGLDAGIIMNAKVWEASGHTGSGFADALVECKKCHLRFRADHVDEANGLDETERTKEQQSMIKCSFGGEHEFTEPKNFNILVKTFLGPVEDNSTLTYLRGETAQGIFTNFKNILESSRQKIPFGIAQIGKAFRNEITCGNYIFRTREFEQAEIEYFIEPNKEESNKRYEYWIEEIKKFYTDLGIKLENLEIIAHSPDKLSHYSIGTSDIEYKYPFGQAELAGIAQRTDFDLSQHSKYSGNDLSYFDEPSQKRYIPYVVEPSMGIDRALLAFLCDAYSESDGSDGREKGEIILRLHPKLAPVKVAVFPLMKKDGLAEIAETIVAKLRQAGINIFYDESGSIGRRYRRQDEIGTPFCITVDYQSKDDNTVTIRDRDTLKQERINTSDINKYILDKLL